MSESTHLPPSLASIVENFRRAPKALRSELLLEFGQKVPELPEHLQNNSEAMEAVPECQTPFFLATAFPDEEHVIFYFDAPQEAPTIRGFAGILAEGLSGQSRETILATPDDFYTQMGLAEVISPLRMRGMSAVLRRLKRQIEEQQASSEAAS